ncbi:hypothetical protein F4X86_04200 [Candidatus Saccharibacteria bacterium]|nr:hypothetical protein [Candidatus Saccharibacteria bacterium]
MSDDASPKLRGGSGADSGPWAIGKIPDKIIYAIGRQIVHGMVLGKQDITGNEFGDMFANAVGGTHYSSPLGLIDVASGKTGWSVKTIKSNNPEKMRRARLISGRNSPDYSFGLSDPRENISITGESVLSIWNSRLNAARQAHGDVRIMVLVRNMQTKAFVLFEEEMIRYVPEDFEWVLNSNNNLQGHKKTDNKHFFTWQFHGGQFTVIRDIPGSTRCFRITRNIPYIKPAELDAMINYSDDWITLVGT